MGIFGIFKQHNDIKKMVNAAFELQARWEETMELMPTLAETKTDDDIYNFMKRIEDIGGIPNQPSCWDTMRASYILVKENEYISEEAKKKYRTFLLSKGVNVR